MAPAPHKTAPQPAPGCAAHTRTQHLVPPPSAHPVHTENLAAPRNAPHTPAAPPSCGAGPGTYSAAHVGLWGTHTPKGPLLPPPSPSEQGRTRLHV
eukprot:scaffold22113_cov64-Phaeocystis_antarctica.AAC.7